MYPKTVLDIPEDLVIKHFTENALKELFNIPYSSIKCKRNSSFQYSTKIIVLKLKINV